MAREGPTEEDRDEALRRLLAGLAAGDDVYELSSSVADLHPRYNTFPGEVFMELAADVLEIADATRNDPIPYEGLRETYLRECEFRGRDNRRIQYAILTSASVRGGLEPDLLDEVVWWRADDYWRYALFAAVALIRAGAERQGVTIAQMVEQLAARSGVTLT
ncbi:MAG: hypothetical protein GWP18_06145 [Proteobacteria bacterium]|nr:hypothetical protein [Pseudomonadota bacterium]